MSLRAVPELTAYRQRPQAPQAPEPETKQCVQAARFEAACVRLGGQLLTDVLRAPRHKKDIPFNQFMFHFGHTLNRFRKMTPPGHANELGATDHPCLWDVLERTLDMFDTLHTQHVVPQLNYADPVEDDHDPEKQAFGLEFDVEGAS